LQRGHGRSRLPSSRLHVLSQANLRIESRVRGHDDQMVNGVEAEADGVKLFFLR
jgi:hypothetical protein